MSSEHDAIMMVSDAESLQSASSCSESDIDDMPASKQKTPLNLQYNAAAPHSMVSKIDWVPSRKTYLELVARRLKAGIPKPQLPADFPTSVKGGYSWSGSSINANDLITHITEEHVKEIEGALKHFTALGLSKNHISPDTFPLPTLAALLTKVRQEVHEGTGLAILRGLQPSRYNLEDNIIIYAGLASYVGRLRGQQDNEGNILVHIKDVGSRVAPDSTRQSPYANNAQPFHNDLGDIIGLYCIDKAMMGGVSRLASAATVYNELATHRPDLIQELAAPNWAFDKHDGSQSYRKRPILFHDARKDRVFFCFSRRQLTGSSVSPRPSYLPQLTEAQAEALDAVHFTADKHALDLQLEKGDVQFSNNLALFHAREAFQDGADSDKRHLIRMWLRDEEHAWTTPVELREVWQEIYQNHRRPVWYMFADHERAHVISRNKSCHG